LKCQNTDSGSLEEYTVDSTEDSDFSFITMDPWTAVSAFSFWDDAAVMPVD
jgi:hypothetical protein